MRWSTVSSLGFLLLLLPCLAIDYDALEKSWEVGDEAEELRTEGDEHYRQLAAKNEDDAKALGPQMIFVSMKGQRREPLPDVASRWKEMLWNGGVEVNIYEVAEAKLLVGLQKGIFVNDVMRFLDGQRDVKKYEWNGKTYSKSNKLTKHNHHQHRQKGTKKTHPKKSKGSKPSKHTHTNGKRTRRETRHPSVPEEATTNNRNDEL